MTHMIVQLLEDIPEAPQLPASYPAMMLLALLPGVFFLVMDPRVSACTAAHLPAVNEAAADPVGMEAAAWEE